MSHGEFDVNVHGSTQRQLYTQDTVFQNSSRQIADLGMTFYGATLSTNFTF